MQKLNLSIPKPCHENWDKMLPDEKGKFCQSCTKTVFDFTKSSTDEIASIFEKNKAEKICGRFRTEQLENIKIEIPEAILYRPMPFRKAFLLALFVVMGTTLFSCKNFNNDYQTLGEVVVVEDTIKTKRDTVEKTLEIKKDSIVDKKCGTFSEKNTVIAPKEIKPIEPPMITGDIVMGIPALPDYDILIKENKEYYDLHEVSKKPVFKNEDKDFSNFILKNLKLPDSIIDNETIISKFIIDSLGNIKNITIARGKNIELNNETIKVLKLSPKWIPGEINGKKVNVQMHYPIRIKLK